MFVLLDVQLVGLVFSFYRVFERVRRRHAEMSAGSVAKGPGLLDLRRRRSRGKSGVAAQPLEFIVRSTNPALVRGIHFGSLVSINSGLSSSLSSSPPTNPASNPGRLYLARIF
jgi:hypothetical protein